MDVRHVEQWQIYRGKGKSEEEVEKMKLLALHWHEAVSVTVSDMMRSRVFSRFVERTGRKRSLTGRFKRS